ncbi:MAG: HupE/UreJ family protein [Flavobacteriaceae bacterium]|nr:MAG: HupE/UreJ family protein [Flavobacteriaceae bacterium]
MDDFTTYAKLGFYHVLDFTAYDHILFLIVLAVVYSFNEWKKVLWLITFFTVGHSLTLLLSAYGILFDLNDKNVKVIEFLIPLTIFITGAINIFNLNAIKGIKDNTNIVLAFVFGLIHGLGFSNYITRLVTDSDNKFLLLTEFALGIEASQIVIVFCILLLGFALKTFLNVSKRDWILVTSAIVIGFVIPMMIVHVFW